MGSCFVQLVKEWTEGVDGVEGETLLAQLSKVGKDCGLWMVIGRHS